jgi:hypothetical protein
VSATTLGGIRGWSHHPRGLLWVADQPLGWSATQRSNHFLFFIFFQKKFSLKKVKKNMVFFFEKNAFYSLRNSYS